MKHKLKVFVMAIGALLGAFVVTFIGYMGYLMVTEDND